jgi:hypothetical protein
MSRVGIGVGAADGATVGPALGAGEGAEVGAKVGAGDGALVGTSDGEGVGANVGGVGAGDGTGLGKIFPALFVGAGVVGAGVGAKEGTGVGLAVLHVSITGSDPGQTRPPPDNCSRQDSVSLRTWSFRTHSSGVTSRVPISSVASSFLVQPPGNQPERQKQTFTVCAFEA